MCSFSGRRIFSETNLVNTSMILLKNSIGFTPLYAFMTQTPVLFRTLGQRLLDVCVGHCPSLQSGSRSYSYWSDSGRTFSQIPASRLRLPRRGKGSPDTACPLLSCTSRRPFDCANASITRSGMNRADLASLPSVAKKWGHLRQCLAPVVASILRIWHISARVAT